MLPSPDELADVVVETVATALAPVLARMTAAEATLQAIGDVRDRVIVVETKAAQPADLGDVRERLAALEVRQGTSALDLQRQISDLEVKAVAPPLVQTSAPEIAPEDIAASVAGLLRKELADLPVARMQKKTVRDAHGQIRYEIEEQV